MNAPQDSLSRTVPSRRRFQTLMEEIRKKRRGSVATAAAASTPTPSVSQAGVRMRSASPAKSASPFHAFIWPYVWIFSVLAILSVVGTLLELARPLASKYIIDNLVLNGHLAVADKIRMIWLWAAGLLALLVLSFVVEGYVTYRIQAQSFLLVRSLRQKLYRHVLRLPLRVTSELKVGGISSRLNDDANAVSIFFGQVLVVLLSAALRIIGGVILIFVINWRLAGLVLIIIPLIFITYALPVTKLRPFYALVSRLGSTINERVTEVLGGLRTVRMYGRETSEVRLYATCLNVQGRVALHAAYWATMISRSIRFLGAISTVGIICIGAYFAVKGIVSIGDIIATALYAAMVIEPVGQVISSITGAQQAMASVDRLTEIMSMKEDQHEKGTLGAPAQVAGIDFDAVSFAYGEDGYALRDVTFSLQSGEVVAIVGRNGAGKTTLTDLVARFHDPTDGEIRVNGQSIRDYSIESYRQMLAIVEQDVFLFDGTIHDNICYGRPSATAENVEDAARLANAHDWIVQLPQGYETTVGERGVRLSGGQRQRLGIARALLRNASILIFDEATSHLDSESEEAVRKAIYDNKHGRATIVVAHRLSTIRMADAIYVLDQGRIVESGKYEELIAKNGLFYDIIHREHGVLLAESAESAWESAAPALKRRLAAI